jgi:hypothetical protein
MLQQQETELDVPVFHPTKTDKQAGMILVRLYSMCTLAPPTASVFSNGINICKTYPSRSAGVLAGAKSSDTLLPTFHTYEVEMFHVTRIFGPDRVGWNRDYRAAQRIYGWLVGWLVGWWTFGWGALLRSCVDCGVLFFPFFFFFFPVSLLIHCPVYLPILSIYPSAILDTSCTVCW